MRLPATRQFILERVRSGDEAVRRDACGDLTAGYWKPSYHYLRLRWRLTAEDAEDAVRAFFAAALEQEYLERYDAAQAKFRTFLRLCLDRYVHNLHKPAEKRGAGAGRLSLDFPGAELELSEMAEPGDADRFFHDETIRFLFGRTVISLEAACARDDRAVVFRVFRHHDLAPSAETTYATVARDLQLSVSQVTNHLHAARRQFRDLALGHLRALSATEAEYRRDARELFGVDVTP